MRAKVDQIRGYKVKGERQRDTSEQNRSNSGRSTSAPKLPSDWEFLHSWECLDHTRVPRILSNAEHPPQNHAVHVGWWQLRLAIPHHPYPGSSECKMGAQTALTAKVYIIWRASYEPFHLSTASLLQAR